MNAKQKELLDRIKKSQQREACSDYIAVGDSDLYDWHVSRLCSSRLYLYLCSTARRQTPSGSGGTAQWSQGVRA